MHKTEHIKVYEVTLMWISLLPLRQAERWEGEGLNIQEAVYLFSLKQQVMTTKTALRPFSTFGQSVGLHWKWPGEPSANSDIGHDRTGLLSIKHLRLSVVFVMFTLSVYKTRKIWLLLWFSRWVAAHVWERETERALTRQATWGLRAVLPKRLSHSVVCISFFEPS